MIHPGTLRQVYRDAQQQVVIRSAYPPRNPLTVYRHGEIVEDRGVLYVGDDQTVGGVPIPGFITLRDPEVVYPIGSLAAHPLSGKMYRGDGLTPGGILLQDVTESGQVLSRVATPVIQPNGGYFATTQAIQIGTETEGAVIRYTLDGTDPTPTYGSLYIAPGFAVGESAIVKAIAYRSGWLSSEIASATFVRMTQLAAPVISPSGQTFTGTLTVTITAETGATIRYTTDGSAPTALSPAYTGPIQIGASTRIRAIATQTHYLDSPIAEEVFTVQQPSGDRTIYFGKLATLVPEASQIAGLAQRVASTWAGDYGYPVGDGRLYIAFPVEWEGPYSIRAGVFEWGFNNEAPFTSAHNYMPCAIMSIGGQSYRVFGTYYPTSSAVTTTVN